MRKVHTDRFEKANRNDEEGILCRRCDVERRHRSMLLSPLLAVFFRRCSQTQSVTEISRILQSGKKGPKYQEIDESRLYHAGPGGIYPSCHLLFLHITVLVLPTQLLWWTIISPSIRANVASFLEILPSPGKVRKKSTNHFLFILSFEDTEQ